MEMAMRDERKRQYQGDAFGWEKGVALSWSVLLAILVVGAIYNRLGKPAIDATSPAAAAVTARVGSASDHSND
jgi:hypothetical protein